MKVELSEEAHAQVMEIDSWWRENRPAAPDLFTNELDQALAKLEQESDDRHSVRSWRA